MHVGTHYSFCLQKQSRSLGIGYTKENKEYNILYDTIIVTYLARYVEIAILLVTINVVQPHFFSVTHRLNIGRNTFFVIELCSKKTRAPKPLVKDIRRSKSTTRRSYRE